MENGLVRVAVGLVQILLNPFAKKLALNKDSGKRLLKINNLHHTLNYERVV